MQQFLCAFPLLCRLPGGQLHRARLLDRPRVLLSLLPARDHRRCQGSGKRTPGTRRRTGESVRELANAANRRCLL
jgi:hypothetical protein